MEKRHVSRRLLYVPSGEEDNPQPSSCIVGEEDEIDSGDENFMTDESLVTDWKRKRVRSSQLKLNKTKRCDKQRQSNPFKKRKEEMPKLYINRWSTERYERAEKCMLEIMKTNGAVVGNKIARPTLRMVARKHIGDTGLLDHLLKHMDGKVAPGGAERFRRCYNPNGVMEYWLESADLVNLRHEAGEQDPYWIPQSIQKAEELNLLRAEMEKMKRDVEELISKKQREDQADMTPESSLVDTNLKLDGLPHLLLQNLSSDKEMHEALFVWKAKTEQQLMEICNSLSSFQDMHKELGEWKETIEHRLREISNTLSTKRNGLGPLLESSDLINFQQDGLPPWLDSADLNIQGDDFISWLDSDDLIKIEPEVVQNPCMVKIEQEFEKTPCVVMIEDDVMQDPCVVKIEDDVAQITQNPCMTKIEDGVVACMVNVEDAEKPCLVSLPGHQFGNGPSQDPKCGTELGVLNEELVKIRRDVEELVTEQEVDDKAISIPNSSVIDCSRMDLDKSLRLLQEMYEGSMKWKAKIEQQVMEISNSLGSITA